MERIKRSLKSRYWRRVITYLLTCCLFLNTSLPIALAEVALQPDGVIRGEINVSPLNGGTTQDMTASDGAIGHFSDFDIATGHFVDCVQPSADASALFRIFSGDGTQIRGRFDANGSIYLIDPAGILFGADSEINVNRLIASGLNMSNEAFDAAMVGGEMVFSGGNGEVTNQGVIRANSVYLIGDKVFNLGPIVAPNGLVVIAAGDQVSLAQDGSNVSVVVSDIGYSLDIRNSNNISADNGKIVLAAGDTFSRAISNVSIIAATGGEISMQAAIVENKGYVVADASTADGDGGSISLIGTEEVRISSNKLGHMSHTFANAGVNGNGGTITITAGTETVEGKVTIEENTLIKATGGSESGDGGSVIITCDDFEIAGDIDASFGNKLSGNELGDPGELVINSPSVIIADSDGPREPDTLYEDYIEALSQKGTSLIVNAEEGITVKDIKDVIGTGEITGQYGSIELHATGEISAVTFDDTTDTIRTTLGDIIIEAGAGGIKSGNLITAKDSSPYSKPYPGKIQLTTHNGGDIETKDLIIESGCGTAEIDVKASGNLTVNGDVIVGQQGDGIKNVPNGENAHAIVKLYAGDNVELNGLVGAYAYGEDDDVVVDDKTIAEIRIFGNTNLNPTGGDVDIYGNLEAVAQASTEGTSEAIIEVDALGNGNIDLHGFDAHAKADQAEVQGTESDEEWSEDVPPDHAQIIIHVPELEAYDDEYLGNHMGLTVAPVVSVLSGDFDPEGDPLTAVQVIDTEHPDVQHGTLTLNEDGTYTYEPDAGFVGTDTFWYTATDGEHVSNPAEVTIELTNELPFANDVGPAETYMNYPVTGSFDYADTPDGEGGPVDFVTVKLVDAIGDVLTTGEGGTVTITKSGDIFTYTYTPPEGYVGDDSFEYTVTDAQGLIGETGRATVTITVKEGEPPKPQEPPTTLSTPALPYMPPAPIPEILKFEISGSPALAKWVAQELGVDERMVDIWAANTLASTKNIQPYDTYVSFKAAATILKDADGSHIAALTQVINEFASSTAPPTEEQMASIADAIARNTDEDSYYAVAGEYLDALVTYIGILNNDMGFSAAESVQFVTDKYVGRLAQGQNVGVVAFIAASLAALGG